MYSIFDFTVKGLIIDSRDSHIVSLINFIIFMYTSIRLQNLHVLHNDVTYSTDPLMTIPTP